jgi:hypothetical protein
MSGSSGPTITSPMPSFWQKRTTACSSVGIERHVGGAGGDARIARGRIDDRRQRGTRELPHDGVLAATAADDQHGCGHDSFSGHDSASRLCGPCAFARPIRVPHSGHDARAAPAFERFEEQFG